MKHNIKLPDGTIQTIDCRLGSGIVDENDKEIFEGDRVRVISPSEGTFVGTVRFEDGSFSIYSPRIDSPDGRYTVEPKRDYPVSDRYNHNFKIIGHVGD